jgi:hypothetical protein
VDRSRMRAVQAVRYELPARSWEPGFRWRFLLLASVVPALPGAALASAGEAPLSAARSAPAVAIRTAAVLPAKVVPEAGTVQVVGQVPETGLPAAQVLLAAATIQVVEQVAAAEVQEVAPPALARGALRPPGPQFPAGSVGGAAQTPVRPRCRHWVAVRGTASLSRSAPQSVRRAGRPMPVQMPIGGLADEAMGRGFHPPH